MRESSKGGFRRTADKQAGAGRLAGGRMDPWLFGRTLCAACCSLTLSSRPFRVRPSFDRYS